MRRSILVSVLVGALVGLAVAAGISIAGSGGSSSSDGSASESAKGSFQAAYASKQGNRPGNGNRRGGRRGGHHHGHGMGFGPLAIAFRGLADRLGVTKAQLREATLGVKKRALDRAVTDGTITQAERDALDACIKAHGKKRSGCNRATARAAHRKLHRAIKQRVKTDAAGLKTQVLEDLAAELPGNKTAAEIDAAARAELASLLDKGVMLGLVSEKGRELALGCWDKPNECDRAALRAEVKKRFRGHRHGGRKGGRRGSHP
jgi:hypothetical protein